MLLQFRSNRIKILTNHHVSADAVENIPTSTSMSVILLLLGLLAIGAGLTAIGFGIPVNSSDPGYTLIVSGTTALSGGLILLGLAAAVQQLIRIAEGLRARPQSRPAR